MKCVFFDIDGTLWDYESVIPGSTVRALKLLKQNGHMAYINTGRTRGYVTDPALLALPFDGIITGCGSRIEERGEVIYEHLLSDETAKRAVDTVRRYGFRAILEGPEYLYMDYDDFKDDIYGRKVMRDLGGNRRGLTDNYGKWKISKLSCDTTGCDKHSCYEELKDEFDIIEHNDTVVEMVPRGFSKGAGMRRLCELKGIDIRETIAIGDGANDMDMFETAGFSVAMGSGSKTAIQAADYVTTGLKEDGIYNALRYLELI